MNLITFFIKSVEELASNFDNFKKLDYDTQWLDRDDTNLFVLHAIDRAVVLNVIEKFTTTYSKDLYDLDVAFLKEHRSILAEPLTHLINISIESGKFPEGWKQARVIPIFKSGAANHASNYRPISILPVLS